MSPNTRVMTTKLLEGPLPLIVFHFSVTDHILFIGTNNKAAPMTHMTIAAITSCFISQYIYLLTLQIYE